MTETNEVHFPSDIFDQYVIVEQMSEDRLSLDYAYNALSIVVATYKAQFEGPETATNLPTGTIDAYFQSEDKAGAQRQLDRMTSYMEKGSDYWFATVKELDPSRQEIGQSDSSGMIKVSPSRATISQKLRRSPPNMYVNDIVVRPAMQHRHVGIDMLYTVTRWGNYSPNASMSLDGYVGSSVNSWFTSLGLQENPHITIPPLVLNEDQHLDQVRFDSGSKTLSDIAQGMGTRKLYLAHSILYPPKLDK